MAAHFPDLDQSLVPSTGPRAIPLNRACPAEALANSPHVPAYLLGPKPLPRAAAPLYRFG